MIGVEGLKDSLEGDGSRALVTDHMGFGPGKEFGFYSKCRETSREFEA